MKYISDRTVRLFRGLYQKQLVVCSVAPPPPPHPSVPKSHKDTNAESSNGLLHSPTNEKCMKHLQIIDNIYHVSRMTKIFHMLEYAAVTYSSGCVTSAERYTMTFRS